MPISGYKMNAVLVQDVSLEQEKHFRKLAEDRLGYQTGIQKFTDTTNCLAYLFDDIENAEAFQSLIENRSCISSVCIGHDEWYVELVDKMIDFIPELAA